MKCLKCGKEMNQNTCDQCGFNLKLDVFFLPCLMINEENSFDSIATLPMKENEHFNTENYFQLTLHEAKKGNDIAMFNVGYMFDVGEYVTQNYQKAMEWYLRASEKNNSSAMNNIGTLYEEGKGVQQDFANAMNWYRKADEKGNLNATLNIGCMYLYGKGVEQNYQKAMDWFQKATNKGNTIVSE